MRKFLLLLSVLCIAIACASCQTNGDGSSNIASQDSCVEQDSRPADESSSEDSTENKNDEWADIEFPRP